jgi:hypothetical protein
MKGLTAENWETAEECQDYPVHPVILSNSWLRLCPLRASARHSPVFSSPRREERKAGMRLLDIALNFGIITEASNEVAISEEKESEVSGA